MQKQLALFFLLAVSALTLYAQEPIGYQTPPPAITALIDAPATPGLSFSPDRKWMLLLEQPGFPSIEEVAEPEMRLAGIRINPRTNGPSRSGYTTGLTLKSVSGGTERPIQRMPAGAKIQNVSWSPDGSKIAFINTSEEGLALWTVDVASATARMQTRTSVNAAMPGSPYLWLDNDRIVCAMIPAGRGAAPVAPITPAGPIVQVNEGKTAPVRTFQDLLTNAYDEALFEHYATAQLAMVEITQGGRIEIGAPGIFTNFSASPDGNYLLVTTLKKPFSYIVPYARFPQQTAVWNNKGNQLKVIVEKPLMDNLPQGFDAVPTGPRSFSWRSDAPASLYWVEAQDEGNPRKEAAVRDKLFHLDAPFGGQPVEDISFSLRYRGISWGSDNLALAYEGWWQSRQQITSRWQPGNPAAGKTTLYDRSTEDRYNDPGNFVTELNKYSRSVLLTADKGKTLYLAGQGASPEGNRPFIDRMELSTKKTTRMWRSEAPYYESPAAFVDLAKGLIITRRESATEPPNYYLRNLNNADLKPLTNFSNPYAALSGAKKELRRYKRADGVEMTGTLYLPAGYDKQKDGPLPMLMWAYPREFKSADAAGQVSGSPYEFIRLNWGSPLYWLTQGYAVFDDFSMPIIGEGDAEPNETFVEQLRANAEAAINSLVEMGVADRRRIAVGGHSYGAFMTANLLAHTDLFAAGIARSGAYNRTLTPFGFQAEERTYWQAPEVYYNLSPFNFADKIKTPILLIHGEADNNSGTFPIQSERFYAALKGHGATARYVVLPAESHGYRARESILHCLWEMDQWLDKHVKNRRDAQ
jgi:dipeptidyl aminopeptidase/acylaminoacyl peptidase